MIPERLAALREKMRAYGVDAYLVPTADYHESEYVGTYFKARTYITGFTGSAGTAVITQDEACLWTDGRYFVQAAKELAGTGVTLMKMDTGLDTGDILYCQSTPIDQDETAGQLHDRLSVLGAKTLSDGLKLFFDNRLTAQKQDDNLSCYAPMLDKSLCNIDWNNSAKDIHNKIRGLSPWPVAISKLNGKIIKIHSSSLVKDTSDIPKFEAGTIFSNDGHMFVSCADNIIEITELQLEGKKKMSAQQFLLGHPINEPQKLQ